ncbi:MAG: TetR/AcrR family transcriptional regulator [Archangium sp.]|nr:TetR/AcrR family transcriptional regulator [Archangium sp.]MDP3569697.1 TetR/AcrR family transcriptional regulator [Archangium sp.]
MLARKVRDALSEDEGIHASLRELAVAAGTSVATLRHYFTDREGLLRGVMESQRAEGAPYLAMSAQAKHGDVRGSLMGFLQGLSTAWFKYGVGKMYASTLALGLGSKAVGPSYVNHVLEPLLQTGESLLRQHLEREELVVDDVRQASLMLISPVVFALLHQDSLLGSQCRPLDLPTYLTTHVDAFLRAFPVKGKSKRV